MNHRFEAGSINFTMFFSVSEFIHTLQILLTFIVIASHVKEVNYAVLYSRALATVHCS